MNVSIQVMLASAAVMVLPGADHSAFAGQITYAGGVSSVEPLCAVKLGVFNPAFDPYRYNFVYGVDDAGNMKETMYSKAVTDGNFVPLGGTYAFRSSGSLRFMGQVTVSGIEGRQLWLFVFDNSNPDLAQNFALCSDSSWLGPPDDGRKTIDASTATTFVFGLRGPSGAIELSGLPFPEPSVFWLLGFGLVSLIFMARRK